MKRCDKMVEVGRRQFLRGGVVAAATLPDVGLGTTGAKAASNGALLDYPSARLANIKELKVNEPVEVAYPDADAPGVLIKLGKAVEGGAGPDADLQVNRGQLGPFGHDQGQAVGQGDFTGDLT